MRYDSRSLRLYPLCSVNAHIIGIKPWKRSHIDPFLRANYSSWNYHSSIHKALQCQAKEGGDLVIWAARETEDFSSKANAQNAKIVRIEDGFIRSAGLGSNHVTGYSIVMDSIGIYYDPRSPSALEQLLQEVVFDDALIERAKKLRDFLVNHGITKYNVGKKNVPVITALNRLRILVPGQVEDDASVRLGGGIIQSNLELLKAVRGEVPEAWIVYKPHPDTEAGTRPGGLPEKKVLEYADQIVSGISASALFPTIDCVHTLTSLLGFEALLREIPVCTWGQPFYSGWGLTEDRQPNLRRTRRLRLEELIAGTLILYPLYIHPRTRTPCSVEQLVEVFLQGPIELAADPSRFRRYARLLRGLARAFVH